VLQGLTPVSLRKVNLLSLEPDEPLDAAGFRHVATALKERLGSRLIGAGVYVAEAGDTIWPYHYHHGIEEWLYVISGEPILRDPEGDRRLASGDVVCFPCGPGGAHTLRGPGRFVIFSTGTKPHMSVYPDSGKVSGPEGILLASSRVDYWHGEGTWDAEPVVQVREAKAFPRQPVVNLNTLAATDNADTPGAIDNANRRPPGFRMRRVRLGARLGARMLGATAYEIDPGEGSAPYHYEAGREEWLLILSGAPTLRHPGGEDVLEPGDVVCFVEGPDGAHRVVNRSERMVRLVFLSTQGMPASAHYPDSGKLLIRYGDDERYIFRKADVVDYWDGESGPS
jgi:uncharacterized cupin superfamily protein